MNQPDRYSRFILAEGVQRVTFTKDTKIENAGMFAIMHEDHTIGNCARMQLHEDDNVLFAGYRIPHPLEPKMVIRIQTNGKKTPEQAINNSLGELRNEFLKLRADFQSEVAKMGGSINYPPPEPAAFHNMQHQQDYMVQDHGYPPAY